MFGFLPLVIFSMLAPSLADLKLADPWNKSSIPIRVPGWTGLPFIGEFSGKRSSFNNTPLVPLHIPHGGYDPCDEKTFTKENIAKLLKKNYIRRENGTNEISEGCSATALVSKTSHNSHLITNITQF